MENWRDVVGFEGRYQVSDLGRVFGPSGKVLKPFSHRDGYLLVKLCALGEEKTRLVHRLVAQAFIPNPDNLPEVDHEDFDKSNNAKSNLSWVTRRRNMALAAAGGVLVQPDNVGEKNGQAVLTEDDVRAIRGARGLTQQAIADAYGVSRRCVGMIRNRERWAHVE